MASQGAGKVLDESRGKTEMVGCGLDMWVGWPRRHCVPKRSRGTGKGVDARRQPSGMYDVRTVW